MLFLQQCCQLQRSIHNQLTVYLRYSYQLPTGPVLWLASLSLESRVFRIALDRLCSKWGSRHRLFPIGSVSKLSSLGIGLWMSARLLLMLKSLYFRVRAPRLLGKQTTPRPQRSTTARARPILRKPNHQGVFQSMSFCLNTSRRTPSTFLR